MYGCAPCVCSAWCGQKRAFGSSGFCIVGIRSERGVLPRDGKHITLCRSPPESRCFFPFIKVFVFSAHPWLKNQQPTVSQCLGERRWSLVTDWAFFPSWQQLPLSLQRSQCVGKVCYLLSFGRMWLRVPFTSSFSFPNTYTYVQTIWVLGPVPLDVLILSIIKSVPLDPASLLTSYLMIKTWFDKGSQTGMCEQRLSAAFLRFLWGHLFTLEYKTVGSSVHTTVSFFKVWGTRLPC